GNAFSDAAQGLGGGAQVGGDHVPGDALCEVGVEGDEILVALFYGGTVGGGEAALHGQVGARDIKPCEGFVFRHRLQQLLVRRFADDHQFGVFQRLDVVGGGLSRQEAVQIRDSPPFQAELN